MAEVRDDALFDNEESESVSGVSSTNQSPSTMNEKAMATSLLLNVSPAAIIEDGNIVVNPLGIMQDHRTLDMLEQARQKFNEENFEQATLHCYMILDKYPQNQQASLLLSAICLKRKDFSGAVKWGALVLQKDPQCAEAYLYLGTGLRETFRLVEAMMSYKLAVYWKPDYVLAYSCLGETAELVGDTEEAIRAYNKALQFNPDLYTVRNQLGNIFRRLGRLLEAKRCYETLLETHPDYAIGWNNLGCVFDSIGDFWLAIHCFSKAKQIDSNNYDAWANLGIIFARGKIYDRAIEAYTKAIELCPCPKKASLHYNLAMAYYERKDFDKSINSSLEAIHWHNISATGNIANTLTQIENLYCNLGNSLKGKELLLEAEVYYKKSLEINPDHIHALNNLGTLKRQAGLWKEAEFFYKRALSISPTHIAALSNLGEIFHRSGRPKLGLECLKEAIKIDPSFVDAHRNLGNLYRDINNFDEAFACYTNIINLVPLEAVGYTLIAGLCKDRLMYQEALKFYQKALKRDATLPDAYCNGTYCSLALCNWKDYDIQMPMVVQIVSAQLTANHLPVVSPHHTMLYPFSHELRKRIAERYSIEMANNAVVASTSLNELPFKHCKQLQRNGRLKIGYLSSDFGNHPTSHLMQSIPGLHSRNVEVFCYALSIDDGSNFRHYIASSVEHFVDLSQIPDNMEAAKRILADGINILVDLNGYTKGARGEIFALRSCPIQVMWLGYPGTSGASYMDYIITDETTIPLEFQNHYSEKLAYMPLTYFIGDHCHMFPHLEERLVILPQTPSDTEEIVSVENNVVVLNAPQAYKEVISAEEIAETFETKSNCRDCENEYICITHKLVENPFKGPVMEMIQNNKEEVNTEGVSFRSGVYNRNSLEISLRKTAYGHEPPNSVLVTARAQYGLPDDAIVFCNFNQLYKIDPPTLQMWVNILKRVEKSVLWLLRFPQGGDQNLLETANALGLDSTRIIFSDVVPKEEHVRRGQLADIGLDTPLCNGHTTSMDILWTGTPIVTLPKETLPSRVTASLLMSLGVPELIAESPSDYEEIAVKLGTDKRYRNLIRAKVTILKSESTLFKTTEYTRNLEILFWKMWDNFNAGNMPMHITELSELRKANS